MRKAFILDTNVLLFDPEALFKFGNNDIIIPIVVIEEVDRFKREISENGRNARKFSRLIDQMRGEGELYHGVSLPKGGRLTVELSGMQPLPVELSMDSADNRILALALSLKKNDPKRPVFFITKDINLRIKADALRVVACDYEPSTVFSDELYSGVVTLTVESGLIEEFYQNKKIPQSSIGQSLLSNQYILLKDCLHESHTAIGKYSDELKSIISLLKPTEGVWGIFPKNVEQAFAIDALLDDHIQLVSLVGKAGTGKTLLAIAAGLMKTIDEGIYHRLLVSRPIFPLGKDIGFLPGDIDEKLNPWMQPIYDNINFLLNASGSKGRRGVGRGCQELMHQGILQVEPLTYIRGRSIPEQYLIVDEAQNLTPHEIKTIVTRAGEGTKIVLTGDSHQIDNPYIDSTNNGLVYTVERFKDQSIAAHVTLVHGERSPLSELASNLL